MKVYRDLVEDGVLVSKEIFDIAECTYTGKDMGERSITATIEFATPIDFQIGDYIKLPMQNLIRSTNGVNGSIASGSDEAEKFYIYTMPTIKKVARAMSNGKAFEHNVTFQSAQYELSCVQMRDLGNSMNADSVIYTGFDNVTFNGAAHELMERIMMVLKEAYHDSEGNPLWSYEISDTVNEDVNLALERFPISFSGNTVMDALLELNNKETINTTFFINNRKIYVGFKRPYFCRVTDGMSIDTNPSSQLFTFQYGKTSDKGVALQYGGLYDITKTVGREVPITKLFAYGASRNLNRYYCSDRVKGGRYVNRLMLPSFDADGKTDFIISEDALQRYGVREATKQFEEIYPSIRYATYGDIRQIKYCIKVKASGRSEDIDQSSYPIARIQCYKVVEGEITGVNKLVEAAPPDDLAIYIHAMDKTVKVVLYGGATDEEAIAKQKAHDTHVPTRVYSGAIPGSCFIVHDRGFDEAGTAYENADRSAWFTSLEDLSGFTEKQKEEIKLNQINYTDTFWLTDLYIFQDYEQTYFSRDGYSAWSWARLNNNYSSEKGHIASDSVVVNEIVHVEPITISDTNMTADGIDKRQSTFDIYLRDLGFTINEQNDFGDMVFLQNGTVKVSILDGLLAGQEFEISGSINSTSPSCICAFNEDGTRNEAFFEEPDYTTDGTNPQTPYDAFEKGAIWRIRLNRTNVDEADYANLNLAMPTKEINAKQGDHLVLLDIFMPDIYIHAAENRLLREARKYLEANDNGSISYAVNFDKVRMQQIPNYALQMREGLNLRVVDEDLNIRTENNGRYIADYRDNKVFSSTESDHNRVWLSANTPIDFTRGKYYTIEFELNDDSSFDTSATNAFALLKTKNDATIAFNPSYSVNKAYLDNGKIAVTIKFNLPDNFDDSSIYYPSLLLVSEISSNMRMYSHWLSYVFERDFDENTNILNYADFTIDSLTIKITDNSGNNEPIREITATLSEQTNATAWATLMNKVATTAKEGAQNKKAIEEVVNTARKNYQALLSLKDSIFDPDGSCDQVFLQVMMQQVGADSMNYQLDNTRSGLGSDGQPTLFNCSCERGSDGYYHFKVYNDDTLRHYVYTQGSQAGNWEIPVGATGVDVQLNGTESYFVCLKCPKNDTVGQWICSTKQYAVNDPEDDTCWFFNWAILTVDSGGVYTLQETRGNAYMYGDNLVCGKISTIAGNSYFDLTHGNFVLGDGTGPALSYINGVLTISGSKGDAEETLRQLGILQGDVEKAQQTAKDAKKQAEEEAAQIRKDYAAAIAESEDKMTEALGASVAEINGGIKALQMQVDGEVNSWFMEGEPTTTNKPASDWTGTDEKGVDFDYRQRHEGDTYTNINNATNNHLDNPDIWENGSSTSESGKSYDEVKTRVTTRIRTKELLKNTKSPKKIKVVAGYSVVIRYFDENKIQITGSSDTWLSEFTLNPNYPYFALVFRKNDNSNITIDVLKSFTQSIFTIEGAFDYDPTAGQSWRWCNIDDEYGTGWHWHKIADSDAIKALQEAAKAQATADGKSTIFSLTGSNKPTNYQKGDMWILQSDTIHTAGKKGDILNANADSATYVASHWTKEVKYTDDTAVLNLEIGGRNLASLSIAQKAGYSYEKYTHNGDADYWKFDISTLYSQTNSFNNDMFGLTYKENTQYAISVRGRWLTEVTEGDTSYGVRMYVDYTDGTREYGLFFVYGSDGSWTCITNASKSVKKIGLIYNRHGYYAMKIKIEQGNKVTAWTPAPEDVEAEILAAEQKADKAQQGADKANNQLDAIDNDKVIARSEKATIETQLEQVQAEYSDIVADAGKYSISTSTFESAYNKAVAALHYHCGKTYKNVKPTTNEENGSIPIVTDTTKDYCYSNISAYYSARQTILVAITEAAKAYAEDVAIQQAQQALDGLEIGGRNLLMNSKTLGIGGWTIASDFVRESDKNIITTKQAGVWDAYANIRNILTNHSWKDRNITFSVQVKPSEDMRNVKLGIVIRLGNNTCVSDNYYTNPNIMLLKGGEWNTLYSTYKPVVDTEQLYNENYSFFLVVRCDDNSVSSGSVINLKDWKVEFGTKATDWTPAPEDVDAAVLEAKESAELANAQLDAIDKDNVIAISERAALETQLEQIQSEYNEIVSDMERNNLDPTSYEKAADKAIEALQYHCGKVYDGTNTAPINADKSITIVAGTSVGYGYGNISAYYTARQTALESIAAAVKASAEQYADNAANDAVSNLEVGGTNLLDNSKPIRLGDWGGDGATVTFDESTNSIKGIPSGNYPRIKNTSVKNIGFIAGKYYTLSMDVKANAVATRSVYIGNNSSSVVALSFGAFSVSTSWNRIKLTALCQDHNAYVAAFGMYIYCGTTNAKDNTEFLQIRNIKLEEGKLATSWSPSVADTEAEIRAAESKAEALGYLTEVLEDSENTTDITGGLVMTNVLMLKDLANAGGSVGAGMSGISSDNILMWGGGAYEDAVHAKDNNFEKLNGSAITTLLKKDGTGKIGIFKVSDTQAVVDVPNQGKVIIDASTTNGGIRVLNSSGRINAALLPTSISSFKPLADSSTTGSEKSVYYSMSAQSVTSTSKTITLSRTGSFTTSGTTTETLEQYTKKTTITTASTRVGGNTVTLNGNIRTSNHDMFVRVTCELLYDGNSIYSISHTEEVQVGYNYISLSNVKLSFPNSITKALTVSNSINMQLKVTVTKTGASSGAYIDAVSLNVSMGSIYMFYKATTAVTYTYPPQTIIGSDGLISLVSNSKYFMVDNSGSTQKIYAKGLGTSGDSGQLIKKNGAYKAFAQSLVQFMHQYIKDTAKVSGFSNALNDLADDLPDDVFITAIE